MLKAADSLASCQSLLCLVLHYALSMSGETGVHSPHAMCDVFTMYICFYVHMLHFGVLSSEVKEDPASQSVVSCKDSFVYRIIIIRPSIVWQYLLIQIAKGCRFIGLLPRVYLVLFCTMIYERLEK